MESQPDIDAKVKEFREFLISKRISSSTIQTYTQYYKRFANILDKSQDKEISLQKIVFNFLSGKHSNALRSALRQILMFHEIRDIDIPRISGHGTKERKIRERMSYEEEAKIRKRLYERRFMYGLLFDITLSCGLRRAEALNIRYRDFRLRPLDETQPCFLKIKGKGEHERWVVVPSSTVIRIKKYLERQPEWKDNERLFKITPTAWHDNFKKAVKAVTPTNFQTHDLRRTRATRWMYEDGDNIMTIKTKLGHKDISTTQLYVNPEDDRVYEDWGEKEMKR